MGCAGAAPRAECFATGASLKRSRRRGRPCVEETEDSEGALARCQQSSATLGFPRALGAWLAFPDDARSRPSSAPDLRVPFASRSSSVRLSPSSRCIRAHARVPTALGSWRQAPPMAGMSASCAWFELGRIESALFWRAFTAQPSFAAEARRWRPDEALCGSQKRSRLRLVLHVALQMRATAPLPGQARSA